MLVTGKEILQHAHKNNYAVGAFNISNLEIAKRRLFYRHLKAQSNMQASRNCPLLLRCWLTKRLFRLHCTWIMGQPMKPLSAVSGMAGHPL